MRNQGGTRVENIDRNQWIKVCVRGNTRMQIVESFGRSRAGFNAELLRRTGAVGCT